MSAWCRTPNNQISVFTGTGQQLVAACRPRNCAFNNAGTLSATSQWSANPSQDGVGTITLTSPGGTTTDLVADNAIQSGEIGAYLQMRDTILPQAQNQLDEMANQMSQALSNQTTRGTPVTPAPSPDIASMSAALRRATRSSSPIPTPSNTQHTITIVGARHGRRAAAADPRRQCNPGRRRQFFRRHELGRVAAQCRARSQSAILKSVRHRPAGAQSTAAATSSIRCRRTSTATSLTSGSPQLPLFLDGTQPITGAISAERLADDGSRRPHHRQLRRFVASPSGSGRLRVEYRLRRCDAAELHSQSDEPARR